MVGINISKHRQYVVFYGDKINGEAIGMIRVKLPLSLANDSVIAGVWVRKYMPKEHMILAVVAFEILSFLVEVKELDIFIPVNGKSSDETEVEEPVVLDSPEPLPFKFGDDGDDEDGEEAIAEPV